MAISHHQWLLDKMVVTPHLDWGLTGPVVTTAQPVQGSFKWSSGAPNSKKEKKKVGDQTPSHIPATTDGG
eukprot:CAMPEP_0174371302 /NCGR_PEP_ID=MMETSP0811_2-20130205/99299_1 /TAXON_ID=73025 ORGANISM="Eutreptiella gymnastica-like, Strain CCMP1594" /NCGR_SAMPLE_ID=MMETSP0811_2 /ASSEMBLY_ACC=CAM_ASM_000667 /LENGTH=69 /DNA_ID=CAMNT_0015517573 /DNA_START=804 /DNA_END=1013 /DNA_ORIENTATION=+